MAEDLLKSIEGKVLSVDSYTFYQDEEYVEDSSRNMIILLIETSQGLKKINFKYEKPDELALMCLNKIFRGNKVLYTISSYDSNRGGKITEYYLRITSGISSGVEYFYYSRSE